MHLLIRVIRRRVLYHRDLVAELGGKANGRFDAGMGYEPDEDELMDAVLLELQIQIGVGEAAGTPMLRPPICGQSWPARPFSKADTRGPGENAFCNANLP
jgi:hypothetical protein